MMSPDTQTMTLLDLLSRAGADDRPALVAPGKPTLTYRQLRENVVALAARLNSLGLGRGDRIAIVMNNGPEVILTFFAAAGVRRFGLKARPLTALRLSGMKTILKGTLPIYNNSCVSLQR